MWRNFKSWWGRARAISRRAGSADLPQGFRYWAFISYSRQDEAVALWMRRRLERYRIPRDLDSSGSVKVPHRLHPVFRDQDEFPTSADLGAAIRAALQECWTLVVLCSNAAAASRWVETEIRQFVDLGRTERIHCLIVNDSAPDCIPPVLQELGVPTTADIREDRHGAFLRIVAGVLQLRSVDELKRRDLKSRRLRGLTLGGVALGLLLAFVLTFKLLNADPEISEFQIRSRVEPAVIEFVVSDREGDPAPLALFYRLSDGRLLEANVSIDEKTSARGLRKRVEWWFHREPNGVFPEGLTEEVEVFVSLRNRSPELDENRRNGATRLVFGNTPPVVSASIPVAGPTLSGNVEIGFEVADQVGDPVDVHLEYRAVGSPETRPWRQAHPAGTPRTGSASSRAPRRLAASKIGERHVFVWDSWADIGPMRNEVQFRIVARDVHGLASAPLLLDLGVVDNNRRPVAALDGGGLLGNPDEAGAVPVPFQVIDEDGDEVDLVFQWTYTSDGFPALPDDPRELKKLLQSPSDRERLRIATEVPRSFRGTGLTANPESSAGRSLFVADGGAMMRAVTAARGFRPGGDAPLKGLTFEVRRPHRRPEAIGPSWSREMQLIRPVDAIPIDDGRAALVLEQVSDRSWRLAERDLLSGAIRRTLVESGAGLALAVLDDEREGALILVTGEGSWELRTPSGNVLVSRSVRGFGRPLALGVVDAFTTIVLTERSLLRLARPPLREPALSVVFQSEARMIAMAVRTRAPRRAYVLSETEPGRPSLWEMSLDRDDARGRLELAWRDDSTRPLPQIADMEVTPEGDELVCLGRDPDRSDEFCLYRIALQGSSSGTLYEWTDGIAVSGQTVSLGEGGFILIACPLANDLLVAGGVQERLVIESYDAVRRELIFQGPVESGVNSLHSWSVILPSRRGAPSAETPSRGTFLWETSDVPSGGEVLMRVVPYDEHRGVESATTTGKSVQGGLALEVYRLISHQRRRLTELAVHDVGGKGASVAGVLDRGQSGWVVSIPPGGRIQSTSYDPTWSEDEWHPKFDQPHFVEIDGDGRLDILALVDGRVATFIRSSQSHYPRTPQALFHEAKSICAGQLDDDGNLDFLTVSAGLSDGQWEFAAYRFEEGAVQRIPGLAPLVLESEREPVAMRLGDVNADGRCDLLVSTDQLLLYWGHESGFVDEPVRFSGSGRCRRVEVTDLDRDGLPDVVASSEEDHEAAVWFQPPLGFGQGPQRPVVLPMESPTDVAVGDLNGDDLDDVVVGEYSHNRGGNIAIFLQRPRRTFRGPRSYGDTSTTHFTRTVRVADVRRDGRYDIVTAKPGGDPPFFLTALVHRPTRAHDQRSHLADTDGFWAVEPADVDLDGDLDLVGEITGGEGLVLVEQTSPGRFAIVARSDPSLGSLVAIVDGVGDEPPGLLSLSEGNIVVSSLLGSGKEKSTKRAFTPLGRLGAGRLVEPCALGDGNGDGVTDLFSLRLAEAGNSRGPLEVVVFPGDPLSPVPLAWAEARAIPLDLGLERPKSIELVDVDGDSALDLVCAADGVGTRVYFGERGSFSFGSPLSLTSQVLTKLISCDVDSDGRVDIAGVAGDAYIFLQDEDGGFCASDKIRCNGPSDLSFGDVDGDGSLDVAIGFGSSSGIRNDDTENRIGVYFQRERGRFPGPKEHSSDPRVPNLVLGDYDSTAFVQSVRIVDLDGDGVPEVLGAAQPGIFVSWGGR